MKKEKFISVFIIIIFFVFLNPVYGNDKYKKWCVETFDYGEYIYEGYKAVAFLKFVSEPPNTDFWQTPTETFKKQEGDCEDAAFLFLDSLAMSQKNAGIVWGWVMDKQTGVSKAHVWCELIARDGIKYIVESFSGWNGIIPANNEYRKHIFKLSCAEFNHLAKYHHKWDIQVDYKELFVIDSGYLMYGYTYSVLHKNLDADEIYDKKQVGNILNKLNKFFLRMNGG